MTDGQRNNPKITNTDGPAADGGADGIPSVAGTPCGLLHLDEITTGRFSLGPSIHARQAIIRRAARFWMALAFPVGALVIGGFTYDTRLWFIAAVVMFILFPTLLFIGWYGILSRPWAVASLFPQVVTLGPDNEVTVEYYPMPGRDTKAPGDLVIPASDISDCRLWGSFMIVAYANHRELIIPLSAFASQEDASMFLRRLEAPGKDD